MKILYLPKKDSHLDKSVSINELPGFTTIRAHASDIPMLVVTCPQPCVGVTGTDHLGELSWWKRRKLWSRTLPTAKEWGLAFIFMGNTFFPRIVTEYPKAARKKFLFAKIQKVRGATEQLVAEGLADAAYSVVESGNTATGLGLKFKKTKRIFPVLITNTQELLLQFPADGAKLTPAPRIS
ncbi:MAG TPA: hypothetical protein VEA59_00920 [Patescibacteria group bacterium]|nr:hypothetical protein [Patescibacteria group bacterium]